MGIAGQQLDLWAPPSAPRARRTDPKTSHDAGAAAAAFAGSHQERILAALRAHGGMTAHEIGAKVGLTEVQVDRRMHELARAGKAARTGRTRPTPAGGTAMVWSALG